MSHHNELCLRQIYKRKIKGATFIAVKHVRGAKLLAQFYVMLANMSKVGNECGSSMCDLWDLYMVI